MSDDDLGFPSEDVLTRYPVYCIYNPGDFISEYYLNEIRSSWEQYGFNLTMLPSITEESDIYDECYMKFTTRPRTFNRNGSRDFFLSEKKRFLTHASAWYAVNEQAGTNANPLGPSLSRINRAFIIEHDCKLFKQINENILKKGIYFLANGSSETWMSNSLNYYGITCKPSVGYMLSVDMARTIIQKFENTPTIDYSLETFLFNIAMIKNQYNWNEFIHLELFCQEIYDPEIGNTVKDEKRPTI